MLFFDKGYCYLSPKFRILFSSRVKCFDSVILDNVVLDVVVDTLYSLISMTFSSSFLLLDSCLHSSSLYNSCIS